MTLTADEKGRLTCRSIFKPGQSYDVQKDAEGRIILVRLVKQSNQAKLVKPVLRNGLLVIPCELDEEALDREIREEREAVNEHLLG